MGGAVSVEREATAEGGGWALSLLTAVSGWFLGPLGRLRHLVAQPRSPAVYKELVRTAVECMQAGTFAAAVELLQANYQPAVAWEALACVLAEAGEDAIPLGRLLGTCSSQGKNVLHLLAPPTSAYFVPEGFEPRDLWAELLDCLEAGMGSLDHLDTLDSLGRSLLAECVCYNHERDSRGLDVVLRMSPGQLMAEKQPFRGKVTTAMHVAVVGRSFLPEHMSALLARVPEEFVAFGKGMHGRTLLLTAIANGMAPWTTHLLTILPEEALVVVDDGGCSALHFACRIVSPLREKVIARLPDDGKLYSAVGRCRDMSMRCSGIPVMFACKLGIDIGPLFDRTPAAALWMTPGAVGEFGNVECTVLHFLTYRADVTHCKAMLDMFEEEFRPAFSAINSYGQPPFHCLFAGSKRGRGGDAMAYSRCPSGSSMAAIARMFLDVLSDEELLLENTQGETVLDAACRFLGDVYTGKELHLLWDVIDELLERTHVDHWHVTVLLGLLSVSSTASDGLRGRPYLEVVRHATTAAPSTLFFALESNSLYIDALCRGADLEPARLLLEATPEEAFLDRRNFIPLVFDMLIRASLHSKEALEALELLLEYAPKTVVTTCRDNPVNRQPLVHAVNYGSADAAVVIVAACPAALDAPCDWRGQSTTPRQMMEAHADPRFRALAQPHVKSAAS